MKNWLTPLLLAASLCALAGCTSKSEVIATGLSVELTRVERAGDGTIRVAWRVNNPNVVTYLIDRVVHKVTLDGTVIGTVTDSGRLGVPARSAVDRTSVLVPAGGQTADNLARLAAKGSASYALESTVFLLLYDDEISKASFSGSGRVPVATK